MLRFLLFFLVFLIIFQWFTGGQKKQNSQDDIVINARKSFTVGALVEMQILNNREEALALPLPCHGIPFTVEEYKNGEWIGKTAKEAPTDCVPGSLAIEAGKTEKVTFGLWGRDFFSEPGRYRVSVKTAIEDKEKTYSKEIEIKPAGVMKKLWHELLYRPIFNTLILLISVIPGHSLGLGIILLTLLIKLILLHPNQKALKSQKAMQRVQPELDAVKLKYKNDQQRLAQETMAIWKKHKVSPMGSCLPLLIQFPILIALFYVIRDGLGTVNPDLFYESLKAFDLTSIDSNFLGIMELTKKSLIALPVIVGGLQFIQMKMSFGKMKPTGDKESGNPMPMMNNMMLYTMPIMIAFFTASLPAAVGFYWGVSTLFGIGQQAVVNKIQY